MTEISVTFDHDDVTASIELLKSKLDNTTVLFDNIASTIQTNVDLLFSDSVDPYGEPWANVDKHRAGGQPLVDTGRLAASITSLSGNYSAEVGTNVIYAASHQHGALKGQYANNVPWGDIPARPFLPNENDGLPDLWRSDIEQEIFDYLDI
jgi:phage virion morphogenesis protein